MESIYRNFYRKFYQRTAGFIPTQPYMQNMYPGDFFQIKAGEIVVLGNIFRKGLIRDSAIAFGNGIPASLSLWMFSDAMNKSYAGTGSGQGSIAVKASFSRQVINFHARGGFYFKANQPESLRMLNWGDVQEELIIKMTQSLYSFRELYIVTESAVAADWTLAVSASERGEIETEVEDEENAGLLDIFGHQKSKTIQSRDIEFFYTESKRKPSFFKAKKLVVQDEKVSLFISDLISSRETHHEWAGSFFDYQFQHEPGYLSPGAGKSPAGILDMLQANELNPSTANLYFKWNDMDLDDIEKLFISYGQ
jgi:hypothetical protein